MTFPENLKYTKNHEWVSIKDDIVTVGITDFAQKELGDIVYLEVDTNGETLDAESVFGTIEAVKTVSDLFMPITGEIIETNKELEENPEKINSDPYGQGWIIKIKINPENLNEDNLLNVSDYKSLISN